MTNITEKDIIRIKIKRDMCVFLVVPVGFFNLKKKVSK